MCGCLWVAGQRCSWTFSSCYIVKQTAWPLSGCLETLQTLSAAHQSSTMKELQQTERQRIAERRTEDRDRERIKIQRTNDDDDDGERLAWWCGWAGCLGTINFVWYLFLFYWYAPWGGKCHHGLRYRCLLGGRLIGLAFDPLAHSEGWGDGVTRAPMAALPSIPHPCLSLLSPPTCSFHHLSIPSVAIYLSLSCFPLKCLLKTPLKCGLWGLKVLLRVLLC